MERSPQKRRPRKITERPRRRQPQHPPHPNTITITHQNNDQARSTLYALAAPTCPAEVVQASLQRNPWFAASFRFPDRPPSAADTEFSIAAEIMDLLLLPLRKRVAGLQF